MKTFKQFIEQTVPKGFPQGVNINIVPGSGDIDRGRRAFGLGRRNTTLDFHRERDRAREKAGIPAQNTNRGAPRFNYPSVTPSTQKITPLRNPKAPMDV